ncbi:hypothetical protein E2C01_101186 [Portunus trituberculatus]|uniref:Uncharacterized protein n=1 Tax=Portunus trituberculatus TaxID=210409 RepID=A0A5B7K8X4_PORTR|nr:hypothetical protein [Portunus trituberculatus]
MSYPTLRSLTHCFSPSFYFPVLFDHIFTLSPKISIDNVTQSKKSRNTKTPHQKISNQSQRPFFQHLFLPYPPSHSTLPLTLPPCLVSPISAQSRPVPPSSTKFRPPPTTSKLQ